MYSINSVTIVGHIGSDAIIRTMNNNQRVANFSIATDHSFKDKENGEWVKRTEWHRVVTYQQGLVGILEKHARKGRLVGVQGMLRTRAWTDKEGTKRYTTEILVSPGCQIQFLEKLNDRGEDDMPSGEDQENDYNSDDPDEIPF